MENIEKLSKKQFGLLGRKLGHSFSPEIHKTIGEMAGCPYEYVIFEREPEEVEDFLRHGSWEGLNVTVPYKTVVMDFLDEISPEARAIGAVNTIVRRGGRLVGHNTDYYGFRHTLENSGVEIAGAKALVFGDGGAAKAVRKVLSDLGAGQVVTVSRKGPVTYEDLDGHTDAGILVNTTPVGMFPEHERAAADPGRFGNAALAVDLIYNPLRTYFLCMAERAGMKTSSGLDMLVYQAVRAAELFMGDEDEWALSKKVDLEMVAQKIKQDLRCEKQNIVLIGMPGAGKTTVGSLLAKELKRQVYDTDELIIQRVEMDIPTIFDKYGEEHFRELEKSAAAGLWDAGGSIISCGGGIIKNDENYFALAKNGFIVFLNRSPETLSAEGRPLSIKHGAAKLYAERLPLYRGWCDVEISIDGLTPEATAMKIIDKFRQMNI